MSFSDFFNRLFGRGKTAPPEPSADPPPPPPEPEPAEKPCILRVSYATDTGFVRSNNEDSFYADGKCLHKFGESEKDTYTDSPEGTHVFGLFDGMGGEDFGEVAAEITANTLKDFHEKLAAAEPAGFQELMNEICRTAGADVREMIHERGAAAGGSTFTAVCLRGGTAYAYWLGDSRIYFFRRKDESLKQLSADHTVAMAKLAAGQAPSGRDHHSLTHFIGMTKFGDNIIASACEPVKLGAGCALLLCSDGLTDMLSDDEISAILSEDRPAPAERLADGALACGGRDNVTCLVVEMTEAPAETPENQGSPAE